MLARLTSEAQVQAFNDLAASLGREVKANKSILNGELAIPDETGRSVFAFVIKRRKNGLMVKTFEVFRCW